MSINTNFTGPVDTKPVRSMLQPVDDKLRLQGGPSNAAWQHEMERAQFDNWFKPFDASATSTTDKRPPQMTNMRAHSSVASLSPRLHLPTILKETELAMDRDAGSQRSTEDTVPRRSMGGAGDPYVAQGGNSSGDRPLASSNLEPGGAPDLQYALGALDRSKSTNAVHSSTSTHASNPPVAPVASEHVSSCQAQISVLAGARLLPEISNPLDTRFVSEAQPQEEASDQLESSESARKASAALAQGVLAQPNHAASPVRLHVQWRGQTADIWLGMDGSAAQVSSQSQIVVAELQRHFAAIGQRVGRIVCNGSVVFDGQLPANNRSDSQFAAQVDAQMRVRAQVHHKVKSDDSEFPTHHPQEEI